MLRVGHRHLIARALIGRALHRRGGRCRFAAPLAAALLALMWLSVGASPAHAGCFATPGTGTTVFFCDADELVVFTVAGGQLRHNRFAAGDPGFADEFDFDNRTVAAAAGRQPVPNATTSRVEVFGNISSNRVDIGDASSPASTILVTFDLKSFAVGNDRIFIDDRASPTGRTVTVKANEVSGLGGTVSYSGTGLDQLSVFAGGGGDTITVESTSTGTVIGAGGGDDTVNVGVGTLDNIVGRLTIVGGDGSADALNLSDSGETTPNSYTLTSVEFQRAGAAVIAYNALGLDFFERISLTSGSGDDTVTVDDFPPGTSLGVELVTGAGNDRVIWSDVSTNAPVATVEAGAGTDTFQFEGDANDEQLLVGDCSGRMTISRGNCTATSGRVSIGSAEQVVVNGGAGRDLVSIAPTAGIALTANGGDGNDEFYVESVAPGATVAIDGGPGNDDVHVGESQISGRAGAAQSIRGALTIAGGPGDNNRLFVQPGPESGAPAPPAGAAAVTVTPTSIGAAAGDNYFGPGGSLTYAGIRILELDGYDVNDTVRVIPSATTEYFLAGNLQTTEDTLDVDLTGTTGATLAIDAVLGVLRFADRRTVTFTGFETRLANGRPIAGLIEFGAASFGAAEGGPATVTVTRTSPLGAASVQLTTSDGTATAGPDYAPASLTVQFAEGETSKTATIAILGDALVEDDETVNLTLSSAVGLIGEAALGPRSTAVLVIDDSGVGDDRQQTPRPGPGQQPPGQQPPGQQPAALPVVSIDDARMAEGNARSASLLFTVRLSAPAARVVTVDFATTDVTARSVRVRGAAPDFVARRGRVTIPAGRTGGAVVIPVLGDTLAEADERFRVTLRNPVGATLGRAAAFGTILDDDRTPARLFVNDISVAEGGAGRTVLRFDVRLTRPAAGPVRFAFATADLTARARADYVPVRGSQTIPAGQVSRTVAVAVLGDTAVEPGEQLRLVLSRVSGAAVLDSVALGTILNDDR